MAGRRQQQISPSNALVASAVAYSGLGKIANVYRPIQNWQKDAWEFYDITPELRFAAGWIANAMSRIILRPGQLNNEGDVERSTSAPVRAALQAMFGNSEGQAAMLHAGGLHLTVAGECYLVGRKVPAGVTSPDGRLWEIIGVHEIHGGGGGVWTIDSNIDGKSVPLASDDAVIRIWRPHPNRRYQADSPVRAMLPVLTEIKYSTLHIFAQQRSRLAGAGVQVLPDNVEFPPPRDSEGREITGLSKAESLTRSLGQVMARSLSDPSDPSALVPVFVTVPPESVDKIKPPIHYWSPFDEKILDARRSAMQRFGVGMDLPPEIVSGMTSNASSSGGVGNGASHWTSWQIEESAVKLHIEPLAGVFVNALVLGYIRPVTKDKNAAVYIDSTALKLQPDRSREAGELFDRGEISAAGMRFYNGIAEEYAPTDQDRKLFILRRLASGSASPEMVAEAAQLLGVRITTPAPDARPAPETPQSPSLADHPRGHALPGNMSLLAAVSEPLVLRALERAGGRLRNQGIKPPGVAQIDVYRYAGDINGSAAKLLEDAWCHVPSVASGICDPTKLTSTLQAYVENLMVTRSEHTREAMCRYLQLVEA